MGRSLVVGGKVRSRETVPGLSLEIMQNTTTFTSITPELGIFYYNVNKLVILIITTVILLVRTPWKGHAAPTTNLSFTFVKLHAILVHFSAIFSGIPKSFRKEVFLPKIFASNFHRMGYP